MRDVPQIEREPLAHGQQAPARHLRQAGEHVGRQHAARIGHHQDRHLHAGPAPSTGVYLDETPVTTISGVLDVHMYDIERVEGLAGPQGTLYGASSQAGTIRIITNKPDASGFSAAYDVQTNTTDRGSVGGSISKTSSARFFESSR